MKELVDVIHESGALAIVDAVTSLGGHEVRVDDWGVDVCYSATQKCLGAPPGLAPISLSAAAMDVLLGGVHKDALDVALSDRDDQGLTPMMHALKNGHTKLAATLLDADPSAKKDKSAEDFGDQEEEPAKEVPAERKADQEAVDSKINPGSDLAMYLSKKFFLTKGQYPHTMKF